MDPTTATISELLEKHSEKLETQDRRINDNERRIVVLEQKDLHNSARLGEVCSDVKWIRETLSQFTFETGVQRGEINSLMKNATQGSVIGVSASVVIAVLYGLGKLLGLIP